MTRTTQYALTALLSFSLAAGCSKEDKSKDADKAKKTPTGASRVEPGNKKAAPGKGKAPTVTMIDQGAEPRQQLRFKVAKGDSQKVDMTMRLSMNIDMPGMAIPETKLPATKMVMGVNITDVTESGDARWEMTVLSADVVDDPSVNPMVVSAARDALKGITDFKGWALITNRGFVKEADISIPDGIDAQMKQMMESTRQSLDQLTAPLPEEAVGVGAKWRVEQVISQQGMTIQQEAVYTVTKIEGNRVHAEVKLTQHGDPQKVDMPGMPAGVTADLLKFETTGGGFTKIDLSKVVPPNGEVTADMAMETNIKAQGQTQKMKMQMGMTITMQELE